MTLRAAGLAVHGHGQEAHSHVQSPHTHIQGSRTHSGLLSAAGAHSHLTGWYGSAPDTGKALKILAHIGCFAGTHGAGTLGSDTYWRVTDFNTRSEIIR